MPALFLSGEARQILEDLALGQACPPKPHPCPLSHRPPTDRERGTWLKRCCLWVALSESVTVRKRVLQTSSLQQGPPLPDGGRAMGEGTGVRFRAGEAASKARLPMR